MEETLLWYPTGLTVNIPFASCKHHDEKQDRQGRTKCLTPAPAHGDRINSTLALAKVLRLVSMSLSNAATHRYPELIRSCTYERRFAESIGLTRQYQQQT